MRKINKLGGKDFRLSAPVRLELALSCWTWPSEDGPLWCQGDGRGPQQYSGGLRCLNNAQLGLRAKNAKKISPSSLQHQQQPEPLIWIHAFMLLCQILTPTVWTFSWNRDSIQTFFQSSIVQLWWACVNYSLTFLFLADRRGPQWGLLLL